MISAREFSLFFFFTSESLFSAIKYHTRVLYDFLVTRLGPVHIWPRIRETRSLQTVLLFFIIFYDAPYNTYAVLTRTHRLNNAVWVL